MLFGGVYISETQFFAFFLRLHHCQSQRKQFMEKSSLGAQYLHRMDPLKEVKRESVRKKISPVKIFLSLGTIVLELSRILFGTPHYYAPPPPTDF